MAAVAHVAAVGYSGAQRLGQTECEQRFRRNFDFPALCQDLSPGTARSADASANCWAFTAAGDCTDDRAENCAATDIFTGSFVSAQAGSGIRLDICGCRFDSITLSVDCQRVQIKCDLVI